MEIIDATRIMVALACVSALIILTGMANIDASRIMVVLAYATTPIILTAIANTNARDSVMFI
jgi:hypothetical protein